MLKTLCLGTTETEHSKRESEKSKTSNLETFTRSELADNSEHVQYVAPTESLYSSEVGHKIIMASTSSRTGRPKRQVDGERLEFLRSLNFTWDEIGALLGVSSKTVKRRAKAWNIRTYSLISDNDLDQKVSEILNNFPRYGEIMIRGHLQSERVGMSFTVESP